MDGERFAVGTKVKLWGMTGTVVSVRGDTLHVRIDGDRWRNRAAMPATADDELEPADQT